MNCSTIEQWLSEYVESSLPAEETQIVAKHLETCTRCTALVAEMKSALSACRHYPSLELDPELVERILLRTSGRPRTRPLRERIHQYFVRPILTPRFAAGAVLAALFLVLMVNVTIPKLKGSVSALSSQGVLGFIDHGVRGLYGEALKAYETKNEWQAQFSRLKTNTWNSLRSIKEQMNEPVEGRKKSQDGEPRKESAPKEKSSGMWLLPA
ncbi:MAG: hypothetical protein H6Q07_2751 [Acidobacteria bacterium]|nr:hypothetical protein [Acidobacteriota bacterium]